MATEILRPRIVVAGAGSGVGKTTVVVGLARALRDRGLTVALFKCGPDYLDPTYHARASGSPSHNLDGWMMGRDTVLETFARASEGADLCLIEGMMGLFDGASAKGDEGSTAEIAKWLDAPVVLIIDASGVARTIAAIASGFQTFDRELRIAGVVCNRVGSRSHLDLLRQALSDPPIIGALPDEPSQAFAERHLGLLTADERAVPEKILHAWGKTTAEWFDLDAVLRIARGAPPLCVREQSGGSRLTSDERCRIGIAYDEAFHFYYEDNLKRLERLGAKLVRFSPLRDRALPDVNGLYFGGGYPEEHAQALSLNTSLRTAIVEFAGAGGPVYAECGGLMYLATAIRTLDGRSHAMVGLIPGETVMCDHLQSLGYVEAETVERSILGPPGLRFRGHQFRYSELRLEREVDCIYSACDRPGSAAFSEGYRLGNVVASYIHAHWASNPRIAEALVESCGRWARERTVKRSEKQQ